MKEIITYYKDKKGLKRGCVVGLIEDNKISVGWSLYNKKAEQQAKRPFTKKIARIIAKNRAQKYIEKGFNEIAYKVPHTLKPLAASVYHRCENLVKGRAQDEK